MMHQHRGNLFFYSELRKSCLFIYIEILKTEYYQREQNENKKQLDNNDNYTGNEKKKRQKSTAPGIPRRSPIQVLTGLDVA